MIEVIPHAILFQHDFVTKQIFMRHNFRLH
jgi:hypothetical protein